MEIENREERLKALITLFLACPKATAEPDLLELYLRVTRNLPTRVFKKAIERLLETHRFPNPPQPAEILSAGHRILSQAREDEEKAARRRELAEARKDALSSGELRRLIAELPPNQWTRPLLLEVLRLTEERERREGISIPEKVQ